MLAVPPSPKAQVELTGLGEEVLVKLRVSLIHPFEAVNVVVNPPITIGLLLAVSSQPAVLVVTNVAVNVPPVT